jgi:hypothetical protein
MAFTPRWATNEAPLRLLGVKLDSKLSFGGHLRYLEKELEPKLAALQVLARYVSAPALRQLYVSGCLSVLCYGAAAWWPVVRTVPSYVEQLEVLHNRFARCICGAIGGSPTVGVLAEAHLVPLATYLDRACWKRVASLVASPHLPVSKILESRTVLPGAKVTLGPPRPSLRTDYLDAKGRCFRILPQVTRVPTTNYHEDRVLFSFPRLAREGTPLPVLRDANADALLAVPHDVLILSDGSVVANVGGTGAAVLLVSGDPPRPPLSSSVSAGRFPCSFIAEMHGIRTGLLVLRDELPRLLLQCPGDLRVAFATDSLSSLQALHGNPLVATDPLGIWPLLAALLSSGVASVAFVFIFAHCGFEDGDAVDRIARSAVDTLPHDNTPIWMTDLQNLLAAPTMKKCGESMLAGLPKIRKEILLSWAAEEPPEPTRKKIREGTFLPFCPSFSTGDQRLLAQLRIGCCGVLGGWRHGAPETCPWCQTLDALGREGSAVRHLFSCPTLAPLRNHMGITSHTDLGRRPAVAVRYARQALALLEDGAWG